MPAVALQPVDHIIILLQNQSDHPFQKQAGLSVCAEHIQKDLLLLPVAEKQHRILPGITGMASDVQNFVIHQSVQSACFAAEQVVEDPPGDPRALAQLGDGDLFKGDLFHQCQKRL